MGPFLTGFDPKSGGLSSLVLLIFVPTAELFLAKSNGFSATSCHTPQKSATPNLLPQLMALDQNTSYKLSNEKTDGKK